MKLRRLTFSCVELTTAASSEIGSDFLEVDARNEDVLGAKCVAWSLRPLGWREVLAEEAFRERFLHSALERCLRVGAR